LPARSKILSRSTCEWQVCGAESESHSGSSRPSTGGGERQLSGSSSEPPEADAASRAGPLRALLSRTGLPRRSWMPMGTLLASVAPCRRSGPGPAASLGGLVFACFCECARRSPQAWSSPTPQRLAVRDAAARPPQWRTGLPTRLR
jgi:hypothetical protein